MRGYIVRNVELIGVILIVVIGCSSFSGFLGCSNELKILVSFRPMGFVLGGDM